MDTAWHQFNGMFFFNDNLWIILTDNATESTDSKIFKVDGWLATPTIDFVQVIASVICEQCVRWRSGAYDQWNLHAPSFPLQPTSFSLLPCSNRQSAMISDNVTCQSFDGAQNQTTSWLPGLGQRRQRKRENLHLFFLEIKLRCVVQLCKSNTSLSSLLNRLGGIDSKKIKGLRKQPALIDTITNFKHMPQNLFQSGCHNERTYADL